MQINFMTFNIQHCRNYVTREIDIDLMVKTIKQCQGEIVGLNEVYGKNNDNPSQAEEIANKLGYYYYFAKAIDYKGIPYGNAIISKYKFKSVETIMVPDPIRDSNEMYETRCILKVEFEYPNCTVLITHIGLVKSEQINAVNTIISLVSSTNNPIILMGDFNMEDDNPTLEPINKLLENTLSDGSLSFPSINPVKKIDYIFISKNVTLIEAKIPEIVSSDHYPHTAIIDIK